MANVARKGDTLTGRQTGNSSYCVHTYYVSCNCDEWGCDSCPRYLYSSAAITGTIADGSSNVYVNGIGMSGVGDRVSTRATCPGGYEGSSSGSGTITGGSKTVFVNGKAVAYQGSNYSSHTGDTSTISGGSQNVGVG